MTRPRRAVLEALAGEAGHVSAEHLVRVLADDDTRVHRASVYRTLDELTRLGVVQHVHVGHGGTAYHLLRADGAHPHASCSGCGRVLDLPRDTLRGLSARLSRDHGFVLDPEHVALSGRCAGCRSGRRVPDRQDRGAMDERAPSADPRR